MVYPKYCVGCHKEGFWLCKNCTKKIVLINKAYCPICSRLNDRGQFCSRCRVKTDLTGVIIAAHYKEGPLKEAIHTYKYDGIFDLKYDLSRLLIESLKRRNITMPYLMVPVPLHHSRLGQRGFNQSELLCKEIIRYCSNFQLISNKLIRVKKTPHQVDLDRKERIENIKNQFEWFGDIDELKGKKVIVVDDVYTTGSTLNECARVLRRSAKAKEVWGLVIAKH